MRRADMRSHCSEHVDKTPDPFVFATPLYSPDPFVFADPLVFALFPIRQLDNNGCPLHLSQVLVAMAVLHKPID